MNRRRTQQRDSPQRDSREKGIDEMYMEAVGEVGTRKEVQSDQAPEGEESDTSAKKPFGAHGSAWIQVSVDEAGQEATLEELFLGGDDALTVEDVVAALQEHYAVSNGIDRDQLQRHFKKARDSVVKGRHVIARGISPVPGDDGRIEYPALESSAISEFPDGRPLRNALEQTELASALKPDITAYLAIPGERLAYYVPPGEGERGTDVYGAVKREPGTPAQLFTGPGIEEKDGTLYATSFGYAVLSNGALELISPIWVAADGVEAAFVHYSELGEPRPPQSDWLMEILQSAGVTSGILEVEMERLCRDGLAATQKEAVVLARGITSVPGADTRIEFSTDYEKRSGLMLEDGSIDLRERNSAVSVAANQLIGEVIAATQGTAGTNVSGQEVSTIPGAELAFAAGDGVRVEEEGGTTRFYAEIDGNLQVKAEKISVNSVLIISGDVNYDTGNIDTLTDVRVSGSVLSGFTVRSGGTITVAGTVDDGAKLIAHTDVIVAQGIVGKATQIVALGNIETKFIQNSSVMSRGNITVGAYVFNGQLRAGGEVTVLSGGGDRGGGIVGGECYASVRVSAKTIGSPTTDRTIVGVGPNPEETAKLDKVMQVIQDCEMTSLRLIRTLGLQSVEMAKIEALIQAAGPNRKKLLVDVVKKLRELTAVRLQSESQLEELKIKLADTLKSSVIEFSKTMFKDVQVKMGDHSVSASTNLECSRFSLLDGAIVCTQGAGNTG